MENTFDCRLTAVSVKLISTNGGKNMNLGTQIKKHRSALALSQEELAEKIFVSRQSISNWENDKTYPDIKSLLMLSELFEISVDELIKGDVVTMKEEISEQEQTEFQRDGTVFTVLMTMMLVLPIPLSKLLGWIGWGIWAVIVAVTLYYGIRVEKFKKKHNVQTYKEILAFTEGKTLSEIEQAREDGKRPYQKVLLVAGSALLAIAVTACMYLIYQLL